MNLILVSKVVDQGGIQGHLHAPQGNDWGAGVVLTHGAGADCNASLLLSIAEQLCENGYHVLRCNLAFRQRRSGPPHPSGAAEDRESLVKAVEYLRRYTPGRMIMAGHSYGGRQASMLAAEDKTIADMLMLLSYPLHPPAKPQQLRTGHFPDLRVPVLFIHGDKDGFGSPDEISASAKLVPAETRVVILRGAGHDLKRGKFDLLALTGALAI